MSDQPPHSSAASTASSYSASVGSASKFPYTLLLSPEFLVCAGSILFKLPAGPSSTRPSTTVNGLTRLWSLRTSPNNLNTSTVLDVSSDDEEPGDPLQICLIHHLRKKEYLLSKGRKDLFEDSLLTTAMRETYEETGYPCKPVPVTLTTRAPVPGKDIKDNPAGRPVHDCIEPFAITIRNVAPGNVKLIHWFISEVTGEFQPGTLMPSESSFRSCWFEADEAVQLLTYEHDREVARQALRLVREELKRRRKLTGNVVTAKR
ncbi:uncharacterized protein EI90DRAFT_330568 [Cantharellus anzutake]|uniref:uncharacterized protein n=1 Tax=Cantharellus anzutake TaxID=1750568 RepID=UPI001903CD4D|nr:uncharacterized protein EI90DRAFT_330568 [Cantharellus anzutake]KAF8335446.1 hypothetical protein EI90DRAFT_330568 [Cantharellus anzutake]